MTAGMEILQESSEPLVLSFLPTEAHANVNGFVHGGYLFYLCDELVGRYVTAGGRKGAAAEGSIHYYRPAALHRKLLASLQERKVGRRLGTYLVELRNEEGVLIADALFTIAFRPEEAEHSGKEQR